MNKKIKYLPNTTEKLNYHNEQERNLTYCRKRIEAENMRGEEF